MFFSQLPKKVFISEVGLRDGLQSEKIQLTLAHKIELLHSIESSGIRIIEIGSFVSPKAVPALADSDELYRNITPLDGVDYRALIMNKRGIERAIDCGIKKVKFTVSASETHSRHNANATSEEVLSRLAEIKQIADEKGIEVSGAIATSFGCPFEGDVPVQKVIDIARGYVNMGVKELSLSDTTGMANPLQVYEYCARVKDQFPDVAWNLHFHNTRGLGFANVFAAMQAGMDRFDSSFAGLGGCPFAPGATGNIATEDLVNMMHEMGISTGINFEKAIATARLAQTFIGHDTASFILKAGGNCSSKRDDV